MSRTSARIRLATLDDISIIKIINEESMSEHYDLDTYQKHIELYNMTYVIEQLAHEKWQPVGYIMGRVEDKVEAYVTSIAVLATSRGQGFGNRLMLAFLVEAKKRNLKSCSLQVRESNTVAIHLYKRLNFHPVKTLEKYYPDEDGILMRRRIK